MDIYFFGSPHCEKCMTLLFDIKEAGVEIEENDKFFLIDALDDEEEEICDEHNVDDLPHVKVISKKGKVLFEKIGMFDPQELKNVVS
jgi:hypothetical protein